MEGFPITYNTTILKEKKKNSGQPILKMGVPKPRYQTSAFMTTWAQAHTHHALLTSTNSGHTNNTGVGKHKEIWRTVEATPFGVFKALGNISLRVDERALSYKRLSLKKKCTRAEYSQMRKTSRWNFGNVYLGVGERALWPRWKTASLLYPHSVPILHLPNVFL